MFLLLRTHLSSDVFHVAHFSWLHVVAALGFISWLLVTSTFIHVIVFLDAPHCLIFCHSAFVRRMTLYIHVFVCTTATYVSYPVFCTHFASRRLTRLGLEPLPPCSMPWADRLPAPVQATLEPKSPSSVQAVLTVIGPCGGRVDLPPWCPPWAAWVAAFAPECVGSARRHWHSWAAGVGPSDLDLAALLGSDRHSTFFSFPSVGRLIALC